MLILLHLPQITIEQVLLIAILCLVLGIIGGATLKS